MDNIIELVEKISENYTRIIDRNELKKYEKLDWGNNGLGDRWAGKKFNYTSISVNGKLKKYSENDSDEIPSEILSKFLLENTSTRGIIGIFVHSIRTNISHRFIHKDIRKIIQQQSCVSCGSNSEIVCDHKNDLYNDERVLNINAQLQVDFQPLCNHCNLQKRQICKIEKQNNKIYSAKNMTKYSVFPFDFPWEKKVFDKEDVQTKQDTYWYDPIEFNRKIYLYMKYVIPILEEIRKIEFLQGCTPVRR